MCRSAGKVLGAEVPKVIRLYQRLGFDLAMFGKGEKIRYKSDGTHEEWSKPTKKRRDRERDEERWRERDERETERTREREERERKKAAKGPVEKSLPALHKKMSEYESNGELLEAIS